MNIYQIKDKIMHKKIIICIICTMMTIITILSLPTKVTAAAKNDFEIKDGVLVKYLGDSKNVVIPNTVKSIGASAFSEQEKIQSIRIPDSVTRIGKMAFIRCTSLTNVNIPKKVTYIGENAFTYCSNLKNITIPGKVTNIRNSTFSDCGKLTSVKFTGKVTRIGDYAFSNCSSLSSVTLPSSVLEIGVDAFWNTPWYKTMTTNSPFFILNNILFDADNCSGIITVPKGVTEIKPSAFRHSKVTEVILQEGLTKIGEYAFATSTLKKVTLPDGLIEIGKGAFNGTKITAITLPNSITAIGDYAFSRCKHLKSIDIPDKVTSIGRQAFAYCISMRKVTIPKSVVTIGKNAFYYNNLLSNIQVSAENPNYAGDGMFLLNRDKTVLLYCAKATGEITIPEGIETIAEGIFSDSDVTKVTFPSTLKTLGNNAFYMCSELTEIKLPSSLTTFADQMFEYCPKLNKINVFEANNAFNYISDNGIIYNADKTTLICNPSSGSVVVPEGVTSIANYAFPNATISVTIPKSVTTLGKTVFNTEMLWRGADQTPFYVYGYVGNIAEKYCKDQGLKFLAYDGAYTITYLLDGGINNLKNPASFHYQSASIELQNPTKAGCIFLYWYKDISRCEDGCCKGEEKVSIIPKKSLGDIELIAKWENINVQKAAIINIKKLSTTKANLVIQSIDGAAGYEILYAKNSIFTSGKKTITSSTANIVLEKLSKSTFYVKVRAYKIDSTGKKIYGTYSIVKKITL